MKKITEFYSKVVGSSYINSQEILRNMNTGDVIIAEREKENPFDVNAIALFNTKKEKLGYLPADVASGLAKQMDKGMTLDITVAGITGRDKKFVGCNLLVIVIDNKEE